MKSRLIVPARKPRNPLVAAARFRQAGSHARAEGSERRSGQQALRDELATLRVRSKPPSA